MMIEKFGLRLNEESKFVNVFGFESLYYFLTKKLSSDYFELVQIREYIESVLKNEIESYDIISDEYGYFMIDKSDAVLVWENNWEDDLPDILVRGYIPTVDVLEIVKAVIGHLEKNNWNNYRSKLMALYESILNFNVKGFEFSLFKRENNFGVRYNRVGESKSRNLIQNYINNNGQIIITSNFYWSREEKFVWNINEVDSFYDFLKTGIDKLESK